MRPARGSGSRPGSPGSRARRRIRAASSLDALERADVPHEWLAPETRRDLFPPSALDDLHGVLCEPDAGVLHARRATQLLVEDASARRAARRRSTSLRPTTPAPTSSSGPAGLAPALFPSTCRCASSGATSSSSAATPRGAARRAGCEYDAGFYGHGDVAGLGVKVAPDFPSDEIDPDTLDRLPLRTRGASARVRRAASLRSRMHRSRRSRLPVRPDERHALPRRPPSGARRRGGSSAAAQATASSTAPPWRSTSPTASRRRASPSRSMRWASAPATQVCAPPSLVAPLRPTSSASISLRSSAFSSLLLRLRERGGEERLLAALHLDRRLPRRAAFGRQLDEHAAAVVGIGQPPHEARAPRAGRAGS